MIRRGIRRAFRLGGGARSLGAEVDDEIRLHLELRVEQLVRDGLAPDEARREAERRFGGLERARHDLVRTAAQRDTAVGAREWLDGLRTDLRQALRALRREPGVAAVVVLTLALGVGANAAMFGVIDRLLLSGPTHVADADRVRRVYVTKHSADGQTHTGGTVPFPVLTDARDATRAFSHVAAYTAADPEMVGRGPDAERLQAMYATGSLFPLLGVRPALGRFFTDAEGMAPAELVAVLGHGTWRRRFGADPGVLGRPIVIGGRTYTVVGVAPRGFTGPELQPVDVWLPIGVRGSGMAADWATSRDVMWASVIGRLAAGAAPERADAELTAAYRRAYAHESGDFEKTADVSVRPLLFDPRGDEPLELAVSRWLVGVAAVVLLVACANVANLLLVRAVKRRREVAVRLALGIGRARLVRLLLVESTMLALAGGAAGLLLAWWGGHLLRAVLLPNVAWDAPPVDARLLGFTAAVTALTALAVGLVPALQASRPSLVPALKAGGAQGGGTRSRLRGALTVTQAALSVVLLVGAGLFERAIEALRRTPGIADAAVVVGTPFRSSFAQPMRVPGLDSVPKLPGGGPYVSAVTGGYFATVGTSVLRGRGIGDGDRPDGERVAVVNETMARTVWAGRDPIGDCVFIGTRGADAETCRRVVGVVEDARRFELREEPAVQVYVPYGQLNICCAMLLARPAGDVVRAVPAVRAALRAWDPALSYVDVTTLQEAVDPQVRPWRLGATMFTVFGALALLVAAIGLYSVMSYSAAQRTHEMGVRLALGARPGDVRRLVLRSGLGLAALGVGIGLAGALVGARWAEPLLFDVSPREPRVFALVAVALLAVALMACLAPARRAARTAPAVALRVD